MKSWLKANAGEGSTELTNAHPKLTDSRGQRAALLTRQIRVRSGSIFIALATQDTQVTPL